MANQRPRPTTIDHLQEREVVEDQQSQEVPEVLAEDDKNPNAPEQQDQILGEQTIEGDQDSNEPTYAAWPSNYMGTQSQDPQSYRLDLDTEFTARQESQKNTGRYELKLDTDKTVRKNAGNLKSQDDAQILKAKTEVNITESQKETVLVDEGTYEDDGYEQDEFETQGEKELKVAADAEATGPNDA